MGLNVWFSADFSEIFDYSPSPPPPGAPPSGADLYCDWMSLMFFSCSNFLTSEAILKRLRCANVNLLLRKSPNWRTDWSSASDWYPGRAGSGDSNILVINIRYLADARRTCSLSTGSPGCGGRICTHTRYFSGRPAFTRYFSRFKIAR